MALTRQQKADNIEALRAHAAEASALFGVSYKGLRTDELTRIRRAFRQEGLGVLKVAKNTLAKRAFEGTPFGGLGEGAEGNVLYVFASAEPPLVAKRLVGYSEEFEHFVPKFALFEEQYHSAEGLLALSRLPTREVALAQLLGTLQAPIAQLARTINEIPAQLVRAVDAVGRSKT